MVDEDREIDETVDPHTPCGEGEMEGREREEDTVDSSRSVRGIRRTQVPALAGDAGAPSVTQAGLGAKQKDDTSEEKPWYKNPSVLMPILQGISAMGTAPTRSLGVALASGLGAGAAGWQNQQKLAADIANKQASTEQINTQSYNNLLDALSKSIISDAQGHPMGVLTSSGRLMNYMDYYNTPPEQREPLATQSAVLNYQLKVLGKTQIPKYPSVAQPTSTNVNAPQSTYEYTPDDEKDIAGSTKAKYRTPTAFEESAKNRDKAQTELQSKYEYAINQSPQINRLSSAIINGGDSPLTGSSLGPLIAEPIRIWNSIVKGSGAEITPEDIKNSTIAQKLSAGQAIAAASEAGQRSFSALNNYAAVAKPDLTAIPRDAAIELLSSNLVDNQRDIDAFNYNKSAQRSSTVGAIYDPYVAVSRFNSKHSSEVIAREKEAVKDILTNPTLYNMINNPDPRQNPKDYAHELARLDAAYKKLYGVDNVTRFFTTKKVQ